jgi:GH25 family lysozyme M1 (1,4-beta-N-acetylmuramidase)
MILTENSGRKHIIKLKRIKAMSEKILKGHDISYANRKIDFKALKAGGADFVIIRTGYAQKTDSMFHSHIAAAMVAGLDIGVYCYARATTTPAAVKEAQYAISVIKPYQLTFPVFYDIEDAVLEHHCTTEQRTDIVIAFIEEIKRAGYYAGIYTNPDWINNKLDYDRLKGYDLWLAAWTQNPDKPTKYDYNQKMWQWGAGYAKGTQSPIDGDLCYVDYPRIIREGGFNHLSPPEKPETDEPSNHPDYDICTFKATEAVNVRLTPCLDGKVLGKLMPGITIAGAKGVKVLKDKFNWQRVNYNGECAWVASEYLTLVE